MKTIILSLLFCIGAKAYSQVYFIEQNISPAGTQPAAPGSNIATMTGQERKVWVMGDKAKILSRSTKEASQSAADLSVNTIKQSVNTSGDNMYAAAEKDIQMKELTLSQMKSQKNPDKKKIAELEEEIKNAKEYLNKMKSSNNETSHKISGTQEKGNVMTSQMDKNELSKDMQKESGNADIIRIDKGLIWKINTAELLYRENKIENQVGGAAMVMPAGLYSIASQDLGDGGTIAGYKTKKYKLTVTMNAGGTQNPYFTSEIWAADELETAKQQVYKFNNDYKLKTGVSALAPLSVNAVLFEMIPELNDKINSIKGMILKKSYKGDGAMASLSYATEIIKVSVEPIDEKTFDLPANLKKQK